MVYTLQINVGFTLSCPCMPTQYCLGIPLVVLCMPAQEVLYALGYHWLFHALPAQGVWIATGLSFVVSGKHSVTG